MGKTTSRINLTAATMDALGKLMTTKVQQKYKEKLNLTE
jgi:hypothetical protein